MSRSQSSVHASETLAFPVNPIVFFGRIEVIARLFPTISRKRTLRFWKRSSLGSNFRGCVRGSLISSFLKRARRELWPQAVTAYLSTALDCYLTAPEEGLNCFTRGLYLGGALGKESEPRREAEKATLEFVRGNANTLEPRSAVGLLRLIQTAHIGEAVEFSALASTLAQSFSAQQKFDEARDAWSICGAKCCVACSIWHKPVELCRKATFLKCGEC